ncbi:hypothetical protein ACU4GH_11955 [Bradyrhizobium betae]
MPITSLSDDHHVVRHVPNALVDWEDEEAGTIKGVFPQAFELKEKDAGYLSTCWREFFAGGKLKQLAGIAAFMGKTRKVTVKQAFAVGRVGDVKAACLEHGQKIRVTHEPDPNENLAYSAIRRYQTDNIELLELLAKEAWNDVVPSKYVVTLIGPWPRPPA